jgi:hypothetical protein
MNDPLAFHGWSLFCRLGLDQGAGHIRSALEVVNGLPLAEPAREAIFHTNGETLVRAHKP